MKCITNISRKSFFLRHLSSHHSLKVVPSENVLNEIDAQQYKPRNHPGVVKPTLVKLPKAFIDATYGALEDFPIQALLQQSKRFANQLHYRVPPMDHMEVKELKQKVREKLLHTISPPADMNEEIEQKYRQQISDKLEHIMRNKVYNWSPNEYNTPFTALLYLFTRSAAEYAVLTKIFSEISGREPNFKPKSLFDFGSGIGTVTWAAMQFWKNDIYEYFNVDSSSCMNDLAEILLKGGDGSGQMCLKGVYYRQFLPVKNVSYDLVVSAFSLMELPSVQARIETIVKLWNKTHNYLVVVENGTNAGFRVINEIREFILGREHEASKGHAFSPCPHDSTCPRFLSNDSTPCNFEVSYLTLPIGQNAQSRQEQYSYIVLKKGNRSSDDEQWPRVVREVLVRSKHSVCRTCTASGKLQEIVFTAAKHGKTVYHCARATKWGDRLPIQIHSLENKASQE